MNIDKEYLSSTELSETLAISEATVKNWIKLNKITPSHYKKNIAYFSKKYANEILNKLKTDSSALKSRRNKKYIKGALFYKDYVSSNSKNLQNIINFTDKICTKQTQLSLSQIQYIIADCTIQLFINKLKIDTKFCENYLEKYLNSKIDLGIYSALINDLIDNKNNAIDFLKNYPELFDTKYIYEKDEDILGLVYISLSNIGQRKAFGAYYTPTKIVRQLISKTNLKNGTIFDPCCGGGNFLLHLPEKYNLKQIFGNDIDEIAVKITRINMALKFLPKDIKILYQNFTNTNFLEETSQKKYDYIIGNPPWGADFSQQEIKKYIKIFKSANGKNIESYDIFIEKSLTHLNKNGTLTFVLPEAILNVKSHKKIREIILKNTSIKYLEYLGNIFDKVQCPSIILKIENTQKPLITKGLEIKTKQKSFVINTERRISSDLFAFTSDDNEYKIIEKISNPNNKVFLKDNAIFALGIVTGDNKKYISTVKTRTNKPVLKGNDINKYSTPIPKYFIEYQPEKFQQVAADKYYLAEEKLLYKFVSNKLVFTYDNKQTLSLNSCNLLIPKLPETDIKYIMAILNSRIAQFFYEKNFKSVKVLRSHLESIPIPQCDKTIQDRIRQKVNKLIKSDDKTEREKIYNELDKKIAKLYGLTAEEYALAVKFCLC